LDQTLDAQLDQIITLAFEKKATDIIIIVGVMPILRIDGHLVSVQNFAPLTDEDANRWIQSTMIGKQFDTFVAHKELDYSFSYQDVRFRANAYFQKGAPALALRLLPSDIRTIADLGLPPVLSRFTQPRRGFVIIAGPTGHGKSTTCAAIIEEINRTRGGHVITIEDPIEYIFQNKKAVFSQREVGTDTNSFNRALRSAVREDPDIIFIGEMRDFETVDAALTLAETGHLVFSTLHTNNAAQSADRMIDMFPPYLQEPARKQLAAVLLGILSQRLVPKVGGGRIVAAEILIATSAVRSLIREGKAHQLDNIIATSAADGMISLDKVLAELVSHGDITLDDGLTWANDPKAVKGMLY